MGRAPVQAKAAEDESGTQALLTLRPAASSQAGGEILPRGVLDIILGVRARWLPRRAIFLRMASLLFVRVFCVACRPR